MDNGRYNALVVVPLVVKHVILLQSEFVNVIFPVNVKTCPRGILNEFKASCNPIGLEIVKLASVIVFCFKFNAICVAELTGLFASLVLLIFEIIVVDALLFNNDVKQ